MPNNAQISFITGQLPQGFCFTSPQQFFEAIIAALQGFLPGVYSTFNFGNNTPAPADQDKPWIRTDAFGNFDRIYTFNGVWVSPNPRPPSDNEVIIWKGSEALLWSYDGGDGTDPGVSAPTPNTGAMWKRDTDFNFKVPVGIGTNGTTYDGNPATVIGVGTAGGEERHVLTVNEMPSHKHIVPFLFPLTGATACLAFANAGTVSDQYTSPVGGDLSHQNMMPYRGVIYARRTARVYFVAP